MGIGLGQRLLAAGKASNSVLAKIIPPMVAREEIADAMGYVENAGVPTAVTPDFIGQVLFDTTGSDFYIAYGTSSGNWAPLGINTLTFAMLNAATTAASRHRTSTTTDSIDASDHLKIIFLNSATGYVTTLPAPIAGFKCTVMSKLQNTSGNHTIVSSASANIIIGAQHDTGGAAGDKGTADDTISFVASQSVPGDKVDLESDGTSWFAHAFSAVAAGMTFTQAS